jgi:hypothetical protein
MLYTYMHERSIEEEQEYGKRIKKIQGQTFINI